MNSDKIRQLQEAHSFEGQDESCQMPKTMKEMRAEIRRLLEENEALKEQIRKVGTQV